MVLVDSSVWIDFLSNSIGHKEELLATMIRRDERVLLGDLVLAEVLQGVRSDREFRIVRKALLSLEAVHLVTPALAIKSAQNYRLLRGAGITVRKTIDCLIATWCIEHGVPLLFSDRDFEPFVEHLGLQAL
jgi:predicted nucleic acid-binding protein